MKNNYIFLPKTWFLVKKKKKNPTKQPLYKDSWENNIYINRFSKKMFKEKFINLLMIDGQKSKAYKFFNKAGHLMRKKLILTKKTEQKLSELIENNRIVEDYIESTTRRFGEECEAQKSIPEKNPVDIKFESQNRCIHEAVATSHNFYQKNGSLKHSAQPNQVNFLDEIQSNHFLTQGQNYSDRRLKENNTIHSLIYPILPSRSEAVPPINPVSSRDSQNHFKKLEYFVKFSVTKSLYCFLKPTEQKYTSFSLETLLHISIENIKPTIEVRKVRIAGTTYQVPAVISKKRQETLAIRWIIESARKRKQKSTIDFAESLAQELVDAFNKHGQARQRRDELHKIAESNRAYIRYRWW